MKSPLHHPRCHLLLFSIAAALVVQGCVKQQSTPATAQVDPALTPAPAVVEAGPSTVIVVADDYVYYPQYEVYYSAHRRQYGYREGTGWSWRPGPPNVSATVLFASPSVPMNFHDSPERHHGDVIRSYPRNWKQPNPGRGDKDDHRDDRQDGARKH